MPSPHCFAVEERRLAEWWAEQDSNLRRLCQQIYSLPPLAAWVSARECASFEGEVQARRSDRAATQRNEFRKLAAARPSPVSRLPEQRDRRCLRSRLERTTR
jgi:hypothetical protein